MGLFKKVTPAPGGQNNVRKGSIDNNSQCVCVVWPVKGWPWMVAVDLAMYYTGARRSQSLT